ncbi:MAG: glycosyltransferase family 2 protein [Patescibacteria group bacterium]|nr:glycosyltransferase family 2 protein [Patescibacteria group bacterium]MDD5554448.1 glycosyltransferase family 2 protein [Patescibacteria group bacterium]
MDKIQYSIIIPIFNEAKAIEKVVLDLSAYLKDSAIDSPYEILAIDDGSTDDTYNILNGLKLEELKIFRNPYNKGYGSALKLGAEKASGRYLIFYDGDGQHNPEDVKRLMEARDGYDMVVGERQGCQGPWARQPGKKILKWLASYLVDFKIPDLNSGLRLANREKFNKYVHLYPNGFSLSTTTTMAFLKAGYNVRYIPIRVNKRVGKSTVSPRDALKTFVLITRIITLFSPMRFFIPISLLFALITIVSVTNDIRLSNISDTSIILFIATIFIFSFGVILDQIAAIRRELNK